MNRIIKSVILLSCVMCFVSCREDNTPPGGHTYLLGPETHHLILKNDATPFEVRIKNYTGWSIGGVRMDSVSYFNTSYIVDGNNEHRKLGVALHDTMTVEWVELYRIDGGRKLKVKPQPNTTGKERSFDFCFFSPFYCDTNLKITQQP